MIVRYNNGVIHFDILFPGMYCKKVKLFYIFTMSYILTVSPKGQITIPSKERKKMVSKKYLLEVKGKTFILKPVKIEVIGDDTADFGLLSESSLSETWDNPEDDIYQEFYSDKSKKK